MHRENFTPKTWITIFIFFVASCKHADEIPFPENEFLFKQPVSEALHLSKAIKLNLEATKKHISPAIRNFDIDKLPVKKKANSDFIPFAKKPEVVTMNWDNSQDSTFNYDDLPAKPLKFDISVMPPPQFIRAGRFHLNPNNPLFLAQFAEPLIGVDVYQIVEDRNGFFWLGTDQGIYRYDGQNLLLYVKAIEKLNIGSMIEDEQGRICAIIRDGQTEYGDGLLIIDPVASIVKRLAADKKELNGFFFMSRDKQGRLWISSGRGPLTVIDENAGTQKTITIKLHGRQTRPIKAVMDKDLNVWISSIFGGLYFIDNKAKKIKRFGRAQGLNADSLTILTIDNQDRIWIGGIFGQVNMIDSERKTITQYYEGQGLSKNLIADITKDDKGNIWLATFAQQGTHQGIFIIDPEKRALRNIGRTESLGAVPIEDIKQDSHGQIWIGTKQGLYISNPNGYRIEHFAEEDITSITEDTRGRIWAASSKYGIIILDTLNQSKRSFSSANGLINNTLQDTKMQFGRMRVVYGSDGFDIFDSSMHKISHYGKSQGLMTDTVNFTFADSKGRIWIGERNITGMDILDTKEQTIRHVGAGQGLKDTAIANIIEDKEGMIWFNTGTGAGGFIDPEKSTVRYMENKTALNDTYFDKVLFPDTEGNIWMGSRAGVYMINTKRDSISYFSTGQGILGESINSVDEYKKKIYIGSTEGLNVLTAPGMSSKHIWEIESIGRSFGIQKEINTYGSHHLASNGKFYWGDKGIDVLEGTGKSKSIPVTYISGITIFDQGLYFANSPWDKIAKEDTLFDKTRKAFYTNGSLPVNTMYASKNDSKWDSVSGPYNLPENLVLPYDHNYIRLHFAQTAMLDTVWYRYMLEGVNKQWSAITSEPFSENYLNLPSGNYNFKVAGKSGGVWSKPVSFSFRIALPWWKTWWAWALYIFVIATAVRFYIRYRSRKLIAENVLLEQKVARRTEELSKSLEELKQTQNHLVQSEKMASLGELTAGIAHEIQNPLNFVNNFSEVNGELIDEMTHAIESGDSSEALSISKDIKQNFEKISQHGKRAESIVRSMLLHSRTSSGQKEATDINALTDEYLRLSYHGMRAKDKSFNAHIKTTFDEKAGKIKIIPQDIGRVLLNLFNNAFYAVNEKKKISDTTYEPTITVSTNRTASSVEIRVKDNGIGIPKKIADKIFQPFFTTKPTGQGTGLGLSLSYDIVIAHGGEIKLETKNEEGTVLIITLPAN